MIIDIANAPQIIATDRQTIRKGLNVSQTDDILLSRGDASFGHFGVFVSFAIFWCGSRQNLNSSKVCGVILGKEYPFNG